MNKYKMHVTIPSKLFVLLILFEMLNGIVPDKKEEEECVVSKTDVLFLQYASDITTTNIDEDNLDSIESDKPVKVIMYGWSPDLGDGDDEVPVGIATEYMKNGNYNVIYVNWDKHAKSSYLKAVECTRNVANVISDFLIMLNEKKEIPMGQFHLIGNSLGAHLAGVTGKFVKGKKGTSIGRITGLDPAGPVFEFDPHPELMALQQSSRNYRRSIDPVGTFNPNGGIISQVDRPLKLIQKHIGKLSEMINKALLKLHDKVTVTADKFHFISISIGAQIPGFVDKIIKEKEIGDKEKEIGEKEKEIGEKEKEIGEKEKEIKEKEIGEKEIGEKEIGEKEIKEKEIEEKEIKEKEIEEKEIKEKEIGEKENEEKVEETLIPEEGRLSKNDAEVVDVIHTDGGILGALKPLGTIDFYPNGGKRPQEDCPLTPIADFCTHMKAEEYFIRSISSKKLVGVKCDSWSSFKAGECKGNTDNIMGENLIPDRKGSFYLETTNELF